MAQKLIIIIIIKHYEQLYDNKCENRLDGQVP